MLLIDTMLVLPGGTKIPLHLKGKRPAMLTLPPDSDHDVRTFRHTMTLRGVAFYTLVRP